MGKVQIGAAIGESFRCVGEAWTRAWGVMLLMVLSVAVVQLGEAVRAWRTAVSLLGLPVALFVSTAAAGALYRLHLALDHPGDRAFAPGPGGLQWGSLEWRLMGANVVVGIILGLLMSIIFIVWAIALGIAISGNPAEVQAIESGSEVERTAAFLRLMAGPAGIVSAVILIPAVAGLVYLGARLALLTPLASETGAFDLGKAWGLARGAVLALIVGAAVIYVLEMLIGVIVGAACQLAANALGAPPQGKPWASAIGQIIAATINTPLFAGLVLYVYRRQRADPGVAATFS